VKKSAECSVHHLDADASVYLFLCPYCVSYDVNTDRNYIFFAEKFRPCTQFKYNSHGYTYIHCVYAISNLMYNISCVIKSANSGYYGQPYRPMPAARQQTSDKTISPCPSKVLLDFPYRRITTIFFIRCYGKRTIL